MTRVLLVTANVGSIFEDEALMNSWISTLSHRVREERPEFLAIHCQEVGEKSDVFFGSLLNHLNQFSRGVVFRDNDVNAFTALASVYLWSCDAFIWNFEENSFQELTEKKVFSSRETNIVEKHKFPKEISKESINSRKGFMRTRFRINRLPDIDFLNVHLFHDACNVIACTQGFPSKFANIRRDALKWTLSHLHTSNPFFIFGDFNFRVDSRALIESLTETTPKTTDDNSIVYLDDKSELLVLIGRKKFEFREKLLFSKSFERVLRFDFESKESLEELPISFPPSYPFAESSDVYMETRCPSWCDRVLFSHSARSLLSETHYSLVGASQPMGDHKPVALSGILSARFVCTTKGVFRETCI